VKSRCAVHSLSGSDPTMSTHRTRFTTHNLHGPDLYRTRRGSVLQCACCDRIEVHFGDFSLRMDVEQFDALCRTVAGAWESMQEEDATTWRFTAGDVSMSLSRADVRQLYILLAGAESMRVLRESLHAIDEGRVRDSVAPR